MGTLVVASAAEAKVKTETVEYRDGDAVLEGYLSYDEAIAGRRPGVVVIHDWMGNGEFSKKKAEDLAALGYVALAADVYGKGNRPKDSAQAAALAGKLKGERTVLRSRVRAALDHLAKSPRVESAKLAAMGFCFGGTAAIELAKSGAPVAGVVSFHGGLDAPTPTKRLSAKLLVLHGADDPFVKAEDIQAFKRDLREAGADWQMVEYSGAVHAFTNPAAGNDNSKGAAYNASADRRSWVAMRAFFEELFGKSS